MKQKNNQRDSGCPVAYGLDTFGDRWSFLILRDMMLKDHQTYSDFLNMDEGIATNILADRLKHLEANGILTKSRDPENRRSYIYSLTPKGHDLAPILIEIIIWSGAHDQRPEALRTVPDQIRKNRKKFEANLRK